MTEVSINWEDPALKRWLDSITRQSTRYSYRAAFTKQNQQVHEDTRDFKWGKEFSDLLCESNLSSPQRDD